MAMGIRVWWWRRGRTRGEEEEEGVLDRGEMVGTRY